MSSKKKIAWLCSFSNAKKRAHLDLWRDHGREGGQWIPNLLSGLQDQNGCEFHVISTEAYLKREIQSYQIGNIHYHCFQSGIPVLGRQWPIKFPLDHLLGFPLNRKRIKTILGRIQPDLVHLFGAENPQYAAGVLDLPETVPWLVTIQGIVAREHHFHATFHSRVRCRVERAILEKAQLFMGELDSREYLQDFRSDFQYVPFYFPVNERLIDTTPLVDSPRYDLLFAGSMTKAKGFGDYLELVRRLKPDFPNLCAAVVGKAEAYPEGLSFIETHNLAKNIAFIGRFPTQKELFSAYRQARIFLAPTYNDCFPSTVRENMLLGVPVLAYATGGMRFVNEPGHEVIRLVPQGDLDALTQEAKALLRSDTDRQALTNRALAFARNEFSLEKNCQKILDTYQKILNP